MLEGLRNPALRKHRGGVVGMEPKQRDPSGEAAWRVEEMESFTSQKGRLSWREFLFVCFCSVNVPRFLSFSWWHGVRKPGSRSSV